MNHAGNLEMDKFTRFRDWVFRSAKMEPQRKYNLDNWVKNEDLQRTAWNRLRSSSRNSSAGTDGITFDGLEQMGAETVIAQLTQELVDGVYQPMPLRKATLNKSGKRRVLGIPTMKDRLLQQMIYCVLEPIVEAELGDESLACRPGLGPVHAIWAARDELERTSDATHIIRTDIRSFFDTVDLELLDKLIDKKLRGRLLRHTLHAQLRSWAKNRRHTHGIAQGAPLSPMLANWFLVVVDRYFAQLPDAKYMRYMDDILIVVRGDEQRANDILLNLTRKLGAIGLALSAAKTVLTTPENGFEFLGIYMKKSTIGVDFKMTTAGLDKLKETLVSAGIDVDDVGNLHGPLNKKILQVLTGWNTYYSSLGDDVAAQAGQHLDQLLGHKPHRNCGRSKPRPVRNLPVWMTRQDPLSRGDTERGAKPGRTSAANSSGVGLVVYRGSSVCPSQLSNLELGEWRERLQEERIYLGASLHNHQQCILDLRLRRRRLRRDAIARVGDEGLVDKSFKQLEPYQQALQTEQAAVISARQLNEELALVRQGISHIRREMRARAETLGYAPVEGLEHVQRLGKRFRRVS
jgi:group II intron reverse transcriptase/maturase